MPYIGQDIVFKEAAALYSLLLLCILCWADNLVYLTFPALSPTRNTFPLSSNATLLPLSYSTYLNLQVLFFPCLHPPLTHHLPTARLISRAGTPHPQLSSTLFCSLLLHSSPPQPPLASGLQVIPIKPLRLRCPPYSFHLLLSCTHVIQAIKSTHFVGLLCLLWFSWAPGFPSFLHIFFPPKLPRHLLLSRTP